MFAPRTTRQAIEAVGDTQQQRLQGWPQEGAARAWADC
jgi:hypothetical protein